MYMNSSKPRDCFPALTERERDDDDDDADADQEGNSTLLHQ
jgi:hypothetical protein